MRVFDIFILELNCVLIIDCIAYFKLEDGVFCVSDFFSSSQQSVCICYVFKELGKEE